MIFGSTLGLVLLAGVQLNRYLISRAKVSLLDHVTAASHQRKLYEIVNSTTDSEEDPPCSDILLHQSSTERCGHALNCDGEYLMRTLLPYAFCLDDPTSSPLQSHPTLRLFFPILFPLSLILSTVMLFRLLASTAENYFSPALEMISAEFQIPPPLAGVTLLALGNGSPDVSAVVNAIKADPKEGIPLSLGELTGGGMFVQSIVVGRIVSIGRKVTGNEVRGVVCHAELVRDMSMYAIAAGYVFWMCEQTTIYYRHVVYMFVLYVGYVVVVVVFEVRRYYAASVSDSSDSIVSDDEAKLKNSNLLEYSLGDIEPDDDDHETLELSPSRQELDATKPVQDRSRDPPGTKHSARIIRVIKIQRERQRMKRMQQRFRPDLIARRLSKPEDYMRTTNVDLQQRMWSLNLFREAISELREHLDGVLFTNGCGNRELTTVERTLILLEAPFVFLRKFVTPLPCEEDYNRAMVAFSIACSPIWLSAYLTLKFEDFDPFHVEPGAGVNLPLVLWPCCLSTVCGCFVLRYGPRTNTMPLRYTVPIALYGFLIAATWIDVISDQLVNVLEFVGVVLRIPSPIMGMTVLA